VVAPFAVRLLQRQRVETRHVDVERVQQAADFIDGA
jgi:hypothetical protein